MGHVAIVVDARESWGEEFMIVHGGLSEEKYAMDDLTVLQATSAAWFHPEVPNTIRPPSRAFHCGAAIGRKVYIFGGHVWVKAMRGLQKFNDLWTLDTDTWEWAAVELLQNAVRPSPRDFAAMVDLPGGKLLLFGGLDASKKRLDDTWIFDTITSSWTELKIDRGRPKARYAHSLARMDSRVYLFGGETNTGLVADLWTLRGATSDVEEGAIAWIPLELPGPSPAPRKGAAIAGVNNWLVIMGGRTAELGWFGTRTDTFHNDVALVNCEAGALQWRTPPIAGEPPIPREFPTLAALSGGRLLLFGGGNGKQIFGDAWWLDSERASTLAGVLSAEAANASAVPPSAQLSGFAGGTGTPLSAVSLDGNFDDAARSSSMQDADSVEAAQAAEIASATAIRVARSTQASTSRPSANWWEGARDADGFANLRSSFGLPRELGMAAASSISSNRVSAAHEMQDLVPALRLKDVAPLLTQYQRLRPQVLGKATAELDRDIWLLASGGQDGVASLGDSVEAGSAAAIVVGRVIFSGNREYHSEAEWEADEGCHHVPKGSPYGWQQGTTSIIYGWIVESAERLSSAVQMPAATRIKRSLFLLHEDPRQMLLDR
ncbi:hypothetical protein WJX75_006758 [Coccomyxa subellipsoidea]|uniref:Galactose oxidase n=1 Tax=Coccomyxa subellipsoidea TaxID=248742 RepID=A0ABR2Z236_9CHLO